MKSTYVRFWKSVGDDVYNFMNYDREQIDLIKINTGEYTKILITLVNR